MKTLTFSSSFLQELSLEFILAKFWYVLFYSILQSLRCAAYLPIADNRYVGSTFQRLQDRIKQHIPKAIRNQTQPNRDLFQSNHTGTSAIGQHLLNNKKCASYYYDNQFSILAKERTLFHLSTLVTTLIKILKLELCRQKEFVYTLKLYH